MRCQRFLPSSLPFSIAPSSSVLVSSSSSSSARLCCSTSTTNNNTRSSSSSTELLSLNQKVESIIKDSRNGGRASQMLPNAGLLTQPWEASCIEVQTEKCRTKSCPIRTTTSQQKQKERLLEEETAGMTEEEKDDFRKKNMKSYIILYYETHTDEGLMAFRSVARRVSEGSLPGVVENRSAFGFAMWKVDAGEFMLMSSGLKLEE